MTDPQAEVPALKERIRQAFNRVPDRINSASIQAVREYKRDISTARRLLAHKGATEAALRAVLSRIES